MSGSKPRSGASGSVSGVNRERSGTVSTRTDKRNRNGLRQDRGDDQYYTPKFSIKRKGL